jgi:hypothetical protein
MHQFTGCYADEGVRRYATQNEEAKKATMCAD